MEWVNNLINGENSSAINLILITLALAILLVVLVWVFKKISGSATRRAMRSRVPRLLITDSTTVDDKRFLVMVRRDNVEHLLLIGGSNDLVVESNIVRAQATNNQSAKQALPAATAHQEPKQIEKTNATEEDNSNNGIAPIAAVASVGAAGLSGISTMAANATSSVSETAENTLEATRELATSATNKVGETASSITEAATSTASDAVEAVSDTASSTADSVVEMVLPEEAPQIAMDSLQAMPEAEVTPDPVDIDLESEISAQLSDALSIEEVSQPAAEAPEEVSNSNEDDEMKRLLDELSGEAKQRAQ